MADSPASPPGGYVARLITDDELAINLGTKDGVKEDMIFNILDENTENITDPITGENLGSIDRIKAQVKITAVSERLSLGLISWPSRGRDSLPYNIGVLMGPKPRSGKLTDDTWPEGVQVGDPVKYVKG
jgi:hypothetical protein